MFILLARYKKEVQLHLAPKINIRTVCCASMHSRTTTFGGRTTSVYNSTFMRTGVGQRTMMSTAARGEVDFNTSGAMRALEWRQTILSALTRLSQRETQKSALVELEQLAEQLENDSLPAFMVFVALFFSS